jgi:hypothetical protein
MLRLSFLLFSLLCAMSQLGPFERVAAPIWEDWATGREEAEEQNWPQTVGCSKRHFQRHLPMSVKSRHDMSTCIVSFGVPV